MRFSQWLACLFLGLCIAKPVSAMDPSKGEPPPFKIKSETIAKNKLDEIREWPVLEGQTLYGVLSEWAKKEGWSVIWDNEYSYAIKASGVITGNSIDIAISNLLLSMGDITPKVYIKMYNGNKVILVTSNLQGA